MDAGSAAVRVTGTSLRRPIHVAWPWCVAAAIACALICWLQLHALDGDVAAAEPKRLRYRILHTAARLTQGQRRRRLRIPATWPGATELAAAFTRITAIPAPGRPRSAVTYDRRTKETTPTAKTWEEGAGRCCGRPAVGSPDAVVWHSRRAHAQATSKRTLRRSASRDERPISRSKAPGSTTRSPRASTIVQSATGTSRVTCCVCPGARSTWR